MGATGWHDENDVYLLLLGSKKRRHAMKPYCTQNDGDCSTCSLVNYGRDCMNQPIDTKKEAE